jgi:integrase
LYKKVLKRRDIAYDELIFPKIPRKLPVVLSPDEVARMIEAAPSLLHRTILMVLYATGIRRTEASLLKVADIDSERKAIENCRFGLVEIRQIQALFGEDFLRWPRLPRFISGASMPQQVNTRRGCIENRRRRRAVTRQGPRERTPSQHPSRAH